MNILECQPLLTVTVMTLYDSIAKPIILLAWIGRLACYLKFSAQIDLSLAVFRYYNFIQVFYYVV